MKLTELLEEERDGLLRAVRAALTPDDACAAIGRTLDRMLFAFNDASPSQSARESAAGMVGAVRAALPLLFCTGEPKLYETRRRKGLSLSPLPLAMLVVGCALCIAAFCAECELWMAAFCGAGALMCARGGLCG